MPHPPPHPHLPICTPQHSLAPFHLDAQSAVHHLYVFHLVGVEVGGGFLAGEGDQVRVLQAEGHFEGEGAAGVGEEMRCYCAGEAGEVRQSVCVREGVSTCVSGGGMGWMDGKRGRGWGGGGVRDYGMRCVPCGWGWRGCGHCYLLPYGIIGVAISKMGLGRCE